MNLLAALAAVLLFAGFAIGAGDRGGPSSVVVRMMLGPGLLGLAWGGGQGAAVAAGAAVIAMLTTSPLAVLVAAGLAATTAFGGSSRWDAGTGLLLGLAIGLAAAGTSAALCERSRRFGSRRELAALGGLGASALLATVDGVRVLHWVVGPGPVGLRGELPGLSLLLRVELVVGLAGALTIAALWASSAAPEDSLSARVGRRALVLAATLGMLSVGVLAIEATRLEGVLQPEFGRSALIVTVAAGLYLWAALALVADSPIEGAGAPRPVERWSAAGTLLACVGALLLAGRASIATDASYATEAVARLGSATFVALAAVLGPPWCVVRILTLSALLLVAA